jgi:secreted PhoX family phosphatase
VKDKKTKFESPAGMALDAAGNIYVTNDGSANGGSDSDSIAIYAAGKFGDVAPIKIISGPDTGLNLPHGIGIDSDGKIYVANDGSDNKGVDSVTVYAPGSSGDAKPIAVIGGSLTGLGKPGGLAVGP